MGNSFFQLSQEPVNFSPSISKFDVISTSPFLFICKYIFLGYTWMIPFLPLCSCCSFPTRQRPLERWDHIPTDRLQCICTGMCLGAESLGSWKIPIRFPYLLWWGDHRPAIFSSYLWWQHPWVLTWESFPRWNMFLRWHRARSVCFRITNKFQALNALIYLYFILKLNFPNDPISKLF